MTDYERKREPANCDNLDKNPQTCTNICPSRLQTAAIIAAHQFCGAFAENSKVTAGIAKSAVIMTDKLIKEIE